MSLHSPPGHDDNAARTRDALRQAFDAATGPVPGDLGLQRLLARCTSPAPAEARTPAPGWGVRLQAWFARPAFAGALAAVLLAQTGALVWLVTHQPERAWSEWRSAPIAAASVTWRLALQPGASEAALRRLLTDHGLVVGGTPSLTGEWWVSGPAEDADRTEAALRTNPLVRSIERDARGPAVR